ncbi:Eco57I restriction-modification methylase domain-containing protein [Helicobacter anatolicus]|uniref:Eco57I restriction-modification methylase domain-containing protein n=1 Tax=Helicobacter anatolicus TaxID=2905874 RepID=UPI001E396902|nr:TaqI-like C-terminal specificity domain-containing protein [Helicobacter anatolicus]MCE3040498.1 Eco57I restriction-modification methylase domain-containing protein [Helicobacter anatolicus]
MDIAKEISNFVTQEFDTQRYKDFVSCVFSNKEGFEFLTEDFKKPEEKFTYIKKEYCLLPKALDLGNFQTLQFYVFEVDSINAKIGLYRELKEKIKTIDSSAVLACFYQKGNPTFRLSLITRSLNEQREIDYSNPKRQSFTLGKDEKTNTAEQNFQKLYTNWQSYPTQATLSEAFSVEPVTKAFFEGYKKLYDEKFALLYNQAIINIFAKAFPQEDSKKAISTFTKKLLGRIVFLYFIQKKGWLGVPKDGKWGEGDKKFLKNLYDNHNDDFYEKALAPLFFDSLNKDRRNNEDYSPIFKCRIPFLNGGLFEESSVDKNEILYGFLDKNFFADIFKLFELYNFTIDESTPNNIDIGIDPEMLGKVFENLIDYNKETGAFYTRRGIVHFMCKNSLVLKLTQVFGEENKEHIENLIYNQESDNNFARKNGSKILSILESLKILDPAIGSGAFPMGLLSEILSIYTTLNKTLDDSELAKTKRKIIENNIYGIDIDSDAIEIAKLRFWLSIAVDEEEPQPLPNLDFKFMQGNSLLETLDGFQLLPQDYNCSQSEKKLDLSYANTASLEKIEKEIHKFFQTTNPNKKQDIKENIRSEIAKILEEQIKNGEKTLRDIETEIGKTKAHGGKESKYVKENEKQYDKLFTQLNNAYKFQESFINGGFRTDLLFLYKLFFGEVFQEGGFDIIIGNPPYIRQEDIFLKNQIKIEFGAFFNGTADIFTYFFAKGMQVLKPSGILSFITSNKWTRAGYGTPLRKLILSNTFSSYIDFNGVKAFENAAVDTSITTLIKTPSTEDWIFPTFALQQNQNPQAVLDNEKMIFSLLSRNSISMVKSYLQEDCFVFGNTKLLALKKKIESIGTPLKEWDISINYGIKTGYNEAFIITTEKREEILNNCKTKEERQATEKIIKKMLRGKDIKRYSYEWADLWLIGTFPSLKLKIDDYPSLKSYLSQFRPRIDQSGEKGCRKKTSNRWFETQDSIAYYEEFEREKIVWAEMTKESCFVYDNSQMLINQTCYFFNSFYNKYLLGVLNSKIIFYYMGQIASNLGDGAFRWIKQYVEKLPIPKITESNQSIANKIIALVEEILKAKEQNPKANTQELEKEIDFLVYSLYTLTPEEIAIIERKNRMKIDTI